MNFSHLNLEIRPIQSQEKLSQNTSQILLITAEDQLEDKKLNALLTSKIKEVFEKKENKIFTHIADREYFICVISSREFNKNKSLGISLYKDLKDENVNAVFMNGLQQLSKEQNQAFLEGFYYGSYQFKAYKKKENTSKITAYISQTIYEEIAIGQIKNLAESVALTRNLVNEPPNKLNALMFSKQVEEAGKHFGFETEILHEQKITELGMGGLLGVNQGSEVPPTFNIMTYAPENAVNTAPLVLVGKGVMFDTGGYSLKIKGGMSGMKADMGGGATVLGIISAVAKNKLPYHIVGLVPATDNKIDGKALLVDDVITMMDGTNVEIQNTDAEGRLVLADALVYAKKYKPQLVIDIATLTGAAAAITGPFGIASAGNQQEDIDELKQAGEKTYERLFQLPLWEEFADLLKSDVADLKNIGGPIGGASTAAQFLKHFTAYNWMHLDIAGAAFLDKPAGTLPAGATGVGVRLVYDFIQNRSVKNN
ncbi:MULTISPECIES: leucyl aminopeptidase family protein [Psychroflexus]|uniref:Leucyl aminopeptidase n=1 Tax=Psychroflexus halocasei TaxID=908615 RepID=A0A1H3WM40_9FLAO|nr:MULTISPECIES: leucyl aminopeptidase [Psychroflexus]MDN6280635.1 leucyl aminopeptidase [Psychroflexus sp.]MDN6310713.1 leucyl aminopeptidase [Psychroflexus sp.]PJX28442.1 peptidase M17 [Psychroflexus sp. S27]SDZ88030.1 leucyl aminopeptidase [Psychroflexus halocasei]